MYTVKATKKNAVRMADTQMKKVLTKKFIPHALLNWVHPVKFTSVTAKRISLGDPLGVQLGLNFHPVECLNLFNWGRRTI